MNCSFCNGKLDLILDMREQALAGAFIKPPFDEEKKYPLKLCFCPDCYAVQIAEHIPPEALFKNYFYKTSAIGTMRKHFSKLAKKIKTLNPKKVVEIGCNDGVLLRELAGTCEVIGIDPADIVAFPDNVAIYNDFLSAGIVKQIGKADVVVACNVFAHISDINEATKCIHDLLTDKGIFIMEANYLPNLLDKLQYDWIYHEHLYYYSLLSLEKHLQKHGLYVSHVEQLKTHAGSIRFFIKKTMLQSSSTTTKELGDDTTLQMRESAQERTKKLLGMSCGLYEELEKDPSIELGAKEKGQLQELRRRVLEEGETQEIAVYKVWGDKLADAPSRLRQAIINNLGVQRMPFKNTQTRAVEKLREEELSKGLDKLETYLTFASKIKHHCKDLNRLLNRLVGEGKTIAGYGACGRSNTMIQYCGLTQLSYMIDDAPAKTGFYTPGSHYKIFDRTALETPPDYILVFAWSFLAEIQSKLKGFYGKIITPLPEIKELN